MEMTTCMKSRLTFIDVYQLMYIELWSIRSL